MQHLWLIPAFPLAGFLINGLAGRRAPRAVVNAVAIGSVVLSLVWVLKTLAALGALWLGWLRFLARRAGPHPPLKR